MTSLLPTLLITDDDDRCRGALREILEPVGYRTLLASSGEEALDIVDNEPIDCLLLDHQMPGITGIETLRLVRAVRSELPCIMITAEDNKRLVREALSLRVFTVLIKPVRREIVTVTVRRALVRRGASGSGPSEEPVS